MPSTKFPNSIKDEPLYETGGCVVTIEEVEKAVYNFLRNPNTIKVQVDKGVNRYEGKEHIRYSVTGTLYGKSSPCYKEPLPLIKDWI